MIGWKNKGLVILGKGVMTLCNSCPCGEHGTDWDWFYELFDDPIPPQPIDPPRFEICPDLNGVDKRPIRFWDNVNGLDTNDGFTEQTAKRTLDLNHDYSDIQIHLIGNGEANPYIGSQTSPLIEGLYIYGTDSDCFIDPLLIACKCCIFENLNMTPNISGGSSTFGQLDTCFFRTISSTYTSDSCRLGIGENCSILDCSWEMNTAYTNYMLVSSGGNYVENTLGHFNIFDYDIFMQCTGNLIGRNRDFTTTLPTTQAECPSFVIISGHRGGCLWYLNNTKNYVLSSSNFYQIYKVFDCWFNNLSYHYLTDIEQTNFTLLSDTYSVDDPTYIYTIPTPTTFTKPSYIMQDFDVVTLSTTSDPNDRGTIQLSNGYIGTPDHYSEGIRFINNFDTVLFPSLSTTIMDCCTINISQPVTTNTLINNLVNTIIDGLYIDVDNLSSGFTPALKVFGNIDSSNVMNVELEEEYFYYDDYDYVYLLGDGTYTIENSNFPNWNLRSAWGFTPCPLQVDTGTCTFTNFTGEINEGCYDPTT